MVTSGILDRQTATPRWPVPESPAEFQRWSLLDFQPAPWIGWILCVSGVVHLGLLWWEAAHWEGPVSLRKPGLFGMSAGLTVWSIAWILTKLHPHRLDRLVSGCLAGSLLVEVGLITLQYWRGVPWRKSRREDGGWRLILVLQRVKRPNRGSSWLGLKAGFAPANTAAAPARRAYQGSFPRGLDGEA